jgi:hypothetical protein
MLDPVNHYLNLHTTVHPSGAVRGPMGPDPAKVIINRGGILNNANYNLAGTSVAPGSIAAVFGSGFTNGAVCLSTEGCSPRFFGGKMVTSMGGTSVTMNGVAAPIFYATPTQLGIQVPVELTGSSTTVVVTVDGQTSAPEAVTLEAAAPGIFSMTGDGKGLGAITHANGALVTPANPAARGEVLSDGNTADERGSSCGATDSDRRRRARAGAIRGDVRLLRGPQPDQFCCACGRSYG